MTLEARCARCGEIFNPHDETDLVHGLTESEEPCGGTGEIVGEWQPAGRRLRAYAILVDGPGPAVWAALEARGLHVERLDDHTDPAVLFADLERHEAPVGVGGILPPCPVCDEAAVVDEEGCCLHCGAARPLAYLFPRGSLERYIAAQAEGDEAVEAKPAPPVVGEARTMRAALAAIERYAHEAVDVDVALRTIERYAAGILADLDLERRRREADR